MGENRHLLTDVKIIC